MESTPSPESGLNTTPFPSTDGEQQNPGSGSQITATSDLTSSDKLSALPPSSPLMRRTTRRSFENFIHGNATFPRANRSDGLFGTETPRGRLSGESDRMSLPTMRSARYAFSRIHRGSDPAAHSPVFRGAKDSVDSLATPSRSPSRVPSPMRLFQQWSAGLYRGHFREDPFIPIDPFKLHFNVPCITQNHHHNQDQDQISACCESTAICLPFPISVRPSSLQPLLATCEHFLTDALPRQVYLHALLRLPSLYFSRVARIFEDAEVSRPDIQKMIDACATGVFMDSTHANAGGGIGMGIHGGSFVNASLVGSGVQGLLAPPGVLPFSEDWSPPAVSPALARFKLSWEMFIDSLLREWKTLNLVSALLLSAILTMLQVPTAIDDPLTRNAALFSLISALMSLSYGCIYIVRFGTMRSMYRASKWAEEARKRTTSICWNVWVLLAMPAVWLAWSMIFFIISILSFVWRTGSTNDPPDPPGRSPLSPTASLVVRIALTALFGLGMVYFAMIVNTLRKYGTQFADRETERGDGVRFGPEVVSDAVVNGSRGDVSVRRIVADVGSDRRGRERTRRTRKEKDRDEMMQTEEEKDTPGLGSTGVDAEREGIVIAVDDA